MSTERRERVPARAFVVGAPARAKTARHPRRACAFFFSPSAGHTHQVHDALLQQEGCQVGRRPPPVGAQHGDDGDDAAAARPAGGADSGRRRRAGGRRGRPSAHAGGGRLAAPGQEVQVGGHDRHLVGDRECAGSLARDGVRRPCVSLLPRFWVCGARRERPPEPGTRPILCIVFFPPRRVAAWASPAPWRARAHPGRHSPLKMEASTSEPRCVVPRRERAVGRPCTRTSPQPASSASLTSPPFTQPLLPARRPARPGARGPKG